jgi:hypothetical protein
MPGFVHPEHGVEPVAPQIGGVVDEPFGGALASEPVEVPLQPGEQIARGGIKAAGADDDRAGSCVRQRRTVEIMPRHDPPSLAGGRGEHGVGQSERPEDARLEKVRIGLVRGASERGGQKIEAEVGIGDRRPGREHERIGLEPCGEGVGGDVGERIVRGPRRMGDLARKPGRMGGEIDEPDRPSALRQRRSELGRVFGQRIGKADHAVRGEARQHLAGERLGDRADPKQCVRAWGFVRIVGPAAEALDRRLTVVDDAEDERRGLDRQEQDLAGEPD